MKIRFKDMNGVPVVPFNPDREGFATFVGHGDHCRRCGVHGNDHYHVKCLRRAGMNTHHYLCPDQIRVVNKRVTVSPISSNGRI